MAPKWRRMYSFSPHFSRPLLFFPSMILYRFPLTWVVGRAQFFARAHFFAKFTSLKNIQFDLSQFEWFDNPENQWLLVVIFSFNSPFCLSRHWISSLLPELTDVWHASKFLGVISCNQSHYLHVCHHEISSHSFQSEILLCTTIQSLLFLVCCDLFK